MKNKKLTFNSLAFGNLKHRKKQYTLLIIGIILSMVFSSGFVFFVSSAVTSAIETHNYKYGKQSEIVTNVVTNDSLEAVLNETYEDHGYMHILGAITTVDSEIDLGTAVGWLDEGGKELYYQSIAEGKMPQKKNEIAIEKSALTRLGGAYKIGDKIIFDLYVQNGAEKSEKPIKKEYTLVGILNDKRSNIGNQHGGQAFELPAAFVADGSKVELGGKESLHCLILTDSEEGAVGTYITALRSSKDFVNGGNTGIYTTGGYELSYTIADMFGVDAPFLLLLVFVAVLALVSNIGIINAFSTNLKERKKQIGLLRSVGATRRQIIKIYGRESFIICLLCVPLSLLISVFAVRMSVNLMGTNFVFKPSWWVLPLSAFFSICVVLLSSLIPLASASRISPMQAIRNIQINRKMKKKKIKTQKEFIPSRLLASRNIKLYKNKQVLTSIILAVAIFGSVFGYSIIGGVKKNNRMIDYDYGIEAEYYDFSYRQLAHYEKQVNGFSDNDVQDVLYNSNVERVVTGKATNGYILVDELTDYLRLCGYTNDVYQQNYSKKGEITPENYHKFTEDNLENKAVKEKAEIKGEVFPLSFYGVAEEYIESLKDAVTVGRIDIDKINSGEEVILLVPEYIELSAWDYDGATGPDMDFEWSLKPTETIADNQVVLDSAKIGDEFKVDKGITLGWIGTEEGEPVEYEYEGGEGKIKTGEFKHTKIETDTKIGAIIYLPADISNLFYDYSFFSSSKPCIVTSVDGIDTFTKNLPYLSMKVHLNQECNDEIEEEMMTLFDRLTAEMGSPSIYSAYERAKSGETTAKTLLLIITAVVALLFTLSGSLINNALTARIRESKKEIGTLRAVGASVKDISSSYIRQLLSVLGFGTILGFVAFALFYGIYCLIFISMGDTTDDFVLTFWQTIAAVIALFVCCVANVYFKVKKEMKNSIVENIREL